MFVFPLTMRQALSREFPLPESIPPKYSVLAPSKIIEAELELAMLEKRCAAISEQLQHTTTHQLRNPSTHPLLQLSKSAQIDMNPLDTILIQQQLSGDQTLASLRPGRFLGSVDPASAFANLLAALNPIRALAGGPTVAAAPDLSVVTRDFTSNGADALPRQLRLNSLLPQSQDRQITHSGGTPSLLQLLQSLSNNVGDIQPRTLIQTAHQGNALRDTETQPQLFGQNIGANAPFQYVTYATTSQACRPQQRSTDVGKLLHLLSLLQQHQNGTW